MSSRNENVFSNCPSSSIQIVYVVAIMIWLAVLYFFRLIPKYGTALTRLIGWIILLAPIILFIIGYISISGLTPTVENFMFRGNLLSVGLILAVPLTAWITEKYTGDRHKLIQMMIIAVMLSLASITDVWVDEKYLCTVKHTKSVIQTMAIFLFISGLYFFISETPASVFTHKGLKY